MKEHHYLGALPKIGHTLWYVASHHNQWLALISFSAAAWKCAARDQWIGWSYRVQYDRLRLITIHIGDQNSAPGGGVKGRREYVHVDPTSTPAKIRVCVSSEALLIC